MADNGRRMTIQKQSSIPLPSSVQKPTGTMRMSLAASTSRAGPSSSQSSGRSNPRQSLFGSQHGTTPLRQPAKPQLGRTPLHSSTRRGSMWPGTTPSMPGSSQPGKDPRPLRDRAFQKKMQHDLIDFLTANNVDITHAALQGISARDYRQLFAYLVHLLDHAFVINEESADQFAADFVSALQCLRFPWMPSSFDSKGLVTPNSMHGWGFFLGVLHWLAAVCKIMVTYADSGHPTIQPVNGESEHLGIPEDFDDELHHREVALEFVGPGYLYWNDGDDEAFDQCKAKAQQTYAARDEFVRQGLDEKTQRLQELETEYTRLKASAPPISKFEDDNNTLKTDAGKFRTILQQYENRKKKITAEITAEQANLISRGEHLQALQSDLAHFSSIVASQNLSAEDVQRMNHDHESLSRTLEDLKQKQSEMNRNVLSLEVNVTNRASAAEEAVDNYMALISTLKLLPPLEPPFEDVDLSLELNTAAQDPQKLLQGPDLRKVVKPALNSIAESKRLQRANLESERIRLDNELDKLTLECENLLEEVRANEKKAAAINEQADDLRDAAQQDALTVGQEAARLEKELSHARTAAMANGVSVKTRLQTAQLSYREQTDRVAKIKEETTRAIVKNSNDIVMFKAQVSQHLRELQEFAEQE